MLCDFFGLAFFTQHNSLELCPGGVQIVPFYPFFIAEVFCGVDVL